MSEYNFNYILLKRRSPFLDFLKVDGELIERLRSWWAWIDGFLKALNELLIRAEKLTWELLFQIFSFECSWMLFFFFSISCYLLWCFPPFESFYSFKK